MLKFTIKSGVPVPQRNAPNPKWNFPLADMKVGDSFTIACKDIREANRVRPFVFDKAKLFRREGRVFVTRLVGTTNLGVWRIS